MHVHRLGRTPHVEQLSQPEVQPISQEQQIAYIKGVQERQLFDRYRKSLNESSVADEFSWPVGYGHSAIPSPEALASKPSELLSCYLFSLSIDPHVNVEETQRIIVRYFQEAPKIFQNAIYISKPASILIPIFKYCPPEVLEESCRRAIYINGVRDCYHTFTDWIEVVLCQENWSTIEKKEFLERFFFTILPDFNRKETFSHFLARVSKDTIAKLSQISVALEKAIRAYQEEIAVYGTAILEDGSCMLVTHPFNRKQADLFVRWFHDNALHHDKAYRFAGNLKSTDWDLIRHLSKMNQSSSSLVSLAMQWILQASKLRFQFQSAITSCASFIESQYGWSRIPDEHYKELAQNLSAMHLHVLMKSLPDSFEKAIFKSIITDHPERISEWASQIVSERSENWEKSGQLKTLFEKISERSTLKEILVDYSSASLLLQVSCAAYERQRKSLLEAIFADKEKGLAIIVSWVDSFLYQGTLNHLPKDLRSLLEEIDLGLPKEIYEHILLLPQVKDNLHLQHIVQEVFQPAPTSKSLEDKKRDEKQQEAIKKLAAILAETGRKHQQKDLAIRAIREDLKGNNERADWVLNFFDNLPCSLWPQLFQHFDDSIRYRFRVFPDVNDRNPTPLSEEKLVELGTQTLLHWISPDEQCIPDSLRGFYYSFKDVIDKVITSFIDFAPVELFIPTLGRLQQSIFFNDSLKGVAFIAKALDAAKVAKTDFLADCLIHQYRSGKKEANYNIIRFGHDLLQAPVISTSEEQSTLFKVLKNKLGNDFLDYLAQAPANVMIPLIKGLYAQDEKYACEFFLGELTKLVNKDKGIGKTIKLFYHCCWLFQAANINIFNLFKLNEFSSTLALIQKLFDFEDDVAEHFSSYDSFSLQLVHSVQPEKLTAIFFKMVQRTLSRQSYNLYEIAKLLKNINVVYKDRILQQFDHYPEVKTLLKQKLEENTVEACDYSQMLPFLDCWIPDWQQKIIQWIKEQILQEKQDAMSYGCQPNFDSIEKKFKSLQEMGKLDLIMDIMRSHSIPDLFKDLEMIYQTCVQVDNPTEMTI